ncbi:MULTISPECIES: hypothetical protein [Bacillus cereus group]|uniref:hypothetical protein n=1 Tax=Bacillus cereus group TaxID=86661 RepID=UPI001E48A107|nr:MULTISPECIES: hypothetical protein [Bacillus cereus group]MCC2414299.1 hypothetical protein [Bacillus paranthracis]MDX5923215.1 hypothetical protein [Bacillus cereus group sp. BfR-BA-01033]MDX5975775.1 hypothetical protein [Bacillus cereus group sp. BfR-BA-00287]
MYVKTYQPSDVFCFWRKIQGGIPVDYDFKYITVAKRGMLQFMIYIHRTKFHRIRGNKVEEFCEHFIQRKGSKFDSFFVLLDEEKQIESSLHEHEITGDVYEKIDCMYSSIPVERDPNKILEKIQHLKEHNEYDFWMKKLKSQRLKELFRSE